MTALDFLKSRESEKFGVKLTGKGPKIFRNGRDITENPKKEIYLNETELKKAGIAFLRSISGCMVLLTDNMPLRVGNGVKVKTRNPGMSDHHICFMGKFVAIEAKMPGKNLDPDQVTYKKEVLLAGGKFITYHSVWELETEMLNQGLIERRLIKH